MVLQGVAAFACNPAGAGPGSPRIISQHSIDDLKALRDASTPSGRLELRVTVVDLPTAPDAPGAAAYFDAYACAIGRYNNNGLGVAMSIPGRCVPPMFTLV